MSHIADNTKYILITGGAGYIGSFTTQEFLRRGYSVVVIDNLSTGFIESLLLENITDKSENVQPKLHFYQKDIRDRDSLRNIFLKHDISAVIHLAGLAIVEDSFKRKEDYFDHNVNGTIAILEICREFQVKNFIFSSSSTIYGNANGFEKLTENHQISSINPYGQTKILCEQKIKEFSNEINSMVLRYFNVAGAGSDLKNGPRGDGSGRLLFKLTESVLSNKVFNVNGVDYKTQDGTCVRDYIHVEDVADIHIKALEYLTNKPRLESETLVLNCGYGIGFSIKEMIQIYNQVNGVNVQVNWTSRRMGDPEYLVGDNKMLIKHLGWKSRFNDPLHAICESTYRWGKMQNRNL